VSKQLIEEWDKKLSDLGFSVGAGFDPHIVKYGFTTAQLEDLHGASSHTPESHQQQVARHLDKLFSQRHTNYVRKRSRSRSDLRAAKQRLRELIWGSKSTR
jgi:hypothetical protein